jgi:4-hydroxybenzoate polyprenyltransferase
MSAAVNESAASVRPTFEAPAGSLLTYLRLLRLPNVFTAVADVMLGFIFTHGAGEPALWLGLLVAASCCIYLAGMVLNDLFDRDIDAVERPGRPIPSGRVPLRIASMLGFGLLGLGVAMTGAVTALTDELRPAVVGIALAGAVLLYDRWLKRTPLGPLGMGACRFLNVLLGMSTFAEPWQPVHWWIAGSVGVYIVGVTWFARTEASASSRVQLSLATLVMLGGVAALARYPYLVDDLLLGLPDRWILFWGVLAALVGWRCIRAIADPESANVQAAVKNSILSLIVLDAAAAVPVGGLYWSIAILALIVPATLLGYWVYST